MGTGIGVFVRRYAMVATSRGMNRLAIQAINSVDFEGSQQGCRVIKNAFTRKLLVL